MLKFNGAKQLDAQRQIAARAQETAQSGTTVQDDLKFQMVAAMEASAPSIANGVGILCCPAVGVLCQREQCASESLLTPQQQLPLLLGSALSYLQTANK